jgi:hypothetical protein
MRQHGKERVWQRIGCKSRDLIPERDRGKSRLTTRKNGKH